MAAVAAAVAVAAAADFVAEVWSYDRSSCSGGTPIPFRLPCKVRHFLRRAVAAAADDESMPQSQRGLLAVANGPRNREWRSESQIVFFRSCRFKTMHCMALHCLALYGIYLPYMTLPYFTLRHVNYVTATHSTPSTPHTMRSILVRFCFRGALLSRHGKRLDERALSSCAEGRRAERAILDGRRATAYL